MDQLALMVALRQVLSTSMTIPIEEICNQTQIITCLKSLISWLNENSSTEGGGATAADFESGKFYLEQEVGWITVSLALGSNSVVHAILYDRFDTDAQEPSQIVLSFLHRSLTSPWPASVTNALYFTANAMSESTNARELLFNQLDLFNNFHKVMFTEPVHMGIISQVMWNLQTLASNHMLNSVIQHQGEQLRSMFRAALTIENN